MNPSRIAALAVGCGSLALGVAACGSSGGSTQAAATSPPSAAATQAQTTQQATSSKPAVAHKAGYTPPGTKLAFGKTAKVGWVPPSKFSAGGPKKAIPLELTVEGIEKGSLADFKNVQLDAAERKSTPFYVKVKVVNLGATGPSKDDPDVTVQGVDDRGQPQQSVTFLGTFSRCDDRQPPQPFSSGRSYESCLTYLIPGGGSIQSVRWNDGPASGGSVTPYFDDPIVWKAG